MNNELYNENHQATYCPEDDKLRLYVGRVPREEFLTLKEEGWICTPKQECDFVAKWTPKREKTSLEYAGYIGDEDQNPTDRAADRAERFFGYLDKRRAEALSYADAYDSKPSVHGYQSKVKAERAVKKHDRLGSYAVTQWSKAEYWLSRTDGVIKNALYKSTPGVRMGRVKKLEAEQRKEEKITEEYQLKREFYIKVLKIKDEEKALKAAEYLAGMGFDNEFYNWATKTEGLTGKEIAEKYLEKNACRKGYKSAMLKHIELRLAYERQMLEACGGRAGELDIEIGGTVGNFIIYKVNKSPASKRVVSVHVLDKKVEGGSYRHTNMKGTDYSLKKIKMERLNKEVYTEPTEEGIKKVQEVKALIKENKPKKPCLLNPTMDSAKRLQKIWNEAIEKKYRGRIRKKPMTSEITEMTQEEYKKLSKIDIPYATKYATVYIGEDGNPTYERYVGNSPKGAIFKMRYMNTDYDRAYSVVILKDKPQKELPGLKVQTAEVPEEKKKITIPKGEFSQVELELK